MDDLVLAAMARWPQVPSVQGWLSLNRRGQWRIHPLADADKGGSGESISNAHIIQFINRNYTQDPNSGNWFFQNGPQRVWVSLAVTPWILKLAADGQSLETHTGLPVHTLHHWYLDQEQNLYAQTEHGLALVSDQDLYAIFDTLSTTQGVALGQVLEHTPLPIWINSSLLPQTAVLLETMKSL